MQTKPSRLWQAVRFCIAGAAGVIAYYASLYCLTEYLGVWYVVSAVIGFILNTGLNFTIQKFWTFQNKETHLVRRQLVLYSLMTVSFLIGNTLFLYLMVQYLHMWYIGAQMILTVVFSILSFVFSGKIFKNERTNI
jgi:putative flippase GtrA